MLALTAFLAGVLGPRARATGANEPAGRGAVDCAALTQHSFAQLPDAPTTIATAEPAVAGGRSVCRVLGSISQKINFALVLPLGDWNGKYYQAGCSGSCGRVNSPDCDDPLRRGYACLATDTGHSGRDWSFYRDNPQQVRDYGHRATHIAALAGKAITQAFYGALPAHAYFEGCSNGGRQAFMEAEHYPDDFDGIIAGGVAFNETGTPLRIAWELLSNTKPDGSYYLSAKDADLLHKAVIKACDKNDGIEDGLIGDPRKCAFDPASLRCRAGQTDDCLSDIQIAVVNRLYAGPMDSKGRPIGDMGGLAKGSEVYWPTHFTPDREGKPPNYGPFITGFFRHAAFSPPNPESWQLKELDFDKDPQRLGMSGMGFDADDPDLRRFKALGGKLLAYQGWADISVVPGNHVAFYQLVSRTMGGLDKTQDFYRLFFVPGMLHCDVGGEGADHIDYTAALENWVERGTAPKMLVGRNYGDKDADPAIPQSTPAKFTRPYFPFPAGAAYSGHGDANDPANWKPVTAGTGFNAP
jgi:feruloyl esterase